MIQISVNLFVHAGDQSFDILGVDELSMTHRVV